MNSIINNKIDKYIKFLKDWRLYNNIEIENIEKCLKSYLIPQEQVSFLRLVTQPTGCSDNVALLLNGVNYRY